MMELGAPASEAPLHVETAEREPNRPPEIWRRPLAMGLDGLILWGVGFPLGLLFFNPLSRLGPWGRLIGFLIALLYFGTLNSRIGGGQTIGKRILRIQVVQSTGLRLSLQRGILRFVVVGVPYFANGLALPVTRTPMAVTMTLSILVFVVGGAVIYLYLFNRVTRRSLHDLLVDSYVIRSRPGGIPAGQLWKGHLAILTGILCVITLSTFVIEKTMGARLGLPELLKVLRAVETSRDVQAASVFGGRFWGPKGSGEYFRVTALLRERPQSLEDTSNRIASIVMRELPDIMSKDQLSVSVAYGFDIGIASAMRSMNTALSPQEWAKRVSRLRMES